MKVGFALPRHLFKFWKGYVNRARAQLAGAIDDAIRPAVDENHGAFPHGLVGAVGLAWGEVQAADIELPTADLALHRLGHAGITHADGVVQIAAHQGQRVAAEIVGKRLRSASLGPVHQGWTVTIAAETSRERQ